MPGQGLHEVSVATPPQDLCLPLLVIVSSFVDRLVGHARERGVAITTCQQGCRDVGLIAYIQVVCGSANHLLVLLHKICRATNPERATVEHMGLDHGGFYVLVAQQLLNGADFLAPLQIQPQLNHPLA